MALLRSGSSGSAVTDLQKMLKAAGYDPGPIDGKYGPKTTAAVKKYQAANDIEPDGIAGESTLTSLSNNDDAEPTEDAKLMSVPGDPEVWKVGNDTYLIYTTEASDGSLIRLAWKSPSKEDTQSFFGPGKDIVYDKEVGALPSDVLPFGSTDELANMSDDPIQTWSSTMATEAVTQPWLLDADYQKFSLMAVLEGRAMSQSEVQQTKFWIDNTPDQRKWMTLFHSDPMAAQQRIDDQRMLTAQTLQNMGVANASDELINFMSDQVAMGEWSQMYFTNQLKAVSDPASGIAIDVAVQTHIGDTALDTTQGKEKEVRDLIQTWLGSSFGDWDDETVSYWAGKLRNDPDAELALVDQLKDQKQALYQGYDRESTYSTIASPWRQFISNAWGESVQDSDPVLNDIIQMNNSGEAGQYLTREGLKRDNDTVVNKVQGDLNASFGGI